MPFYASLRYLCQSDHSLFFSMCGAMGVNNYGNFAYYLTSPLVWISTLFSLDRLPDVIYVITLIKFGLCGTSFCVYLLYAYREKRYKLSILLLSVSYALMSYNIAYALNLMWLDGVMLLPLLLLGVENVIKDKQCILLTTVVAASLILNYYISFMSFVFLALYTVARLTELRKWSIRRCIKIVASMIVGFGISMPVVLPGICATVSGKLSEGEYEIKQVFRYSLLNVLGQLFSGKYDTVYDDGLPFIFCGTCTIVMVLAYFVLTKDGLKTKLMYAGMIIFYIIAMCFVPLDRFMHGLRETTCFEVRYGYAFCCLLLILAYRSMESIIELLDKYKITNIIRVIAPIFVVFELFMNGSICTSGLMVEAHYKTYSEYKMVLDAKRSLLERINDTDVYRVSDTAGYTHNDGAWLGYNGFGYFSSCYNLEMMNFLGDLGEDQIFHDLINRRRTPLEESLLGAKYILEYITISEPEHVLGVEGMYMLSQNDKALPLGYMTEYDASYKNVGISQNAFLNQNNMAKEMSGINEDVFVEIEPEHYEVIDEQDYAKHIKGEFIAQEDTSLWVYFEWADFSERSEKNVYITDENNPHFNGGIQEKTLIVNGENYGSFLDDHSSYIMYLGDYLKGDKIEIEALSQVYFGDMHVCYLNKGVYERVISRLNEETLNITRYTGNYFEGVVENTKPGYLFLSLPNIDGWNVKVDGINVEPANYRNVFMLIPLEKGRHSINMRFTPPGLAIGIVIGILSFIVGILIIYRDIMKNGGENGVQKTEKV